MSSNQVFKQNALFLQHYLGLKDVHIADMARAKGKALTKSYVGKILKNSANANISLDKVDAFAAVFEQRPIDLINPLGFDENGISIGHTSVLNVELLSQSIVEVESILSHMNVKDSEFKAKAIALVYGHKASGKEGDFENVLRQLLLEDV